MPFYDFGKIQTEAGEIQLRTLLEKDVPIQTAYYYDSPKEFLEDIGFNTAQMPAREEFEARIYKRLQAPEHTTEPPRVVVAELNGKAVSMVFLDLRYQTDKMPRMHFHIFDPTLRGKGIGGQIFMTAVREFSRHHGFKTLWIEPKAENKRMNGLMRKLGFKYLGDHLTPPRAMVHEMVCSRYEITV